MRFTVERPSGIGLLIGQHKDPEPPLAPLGKIRRDARGRVTGGATEDGWIFEMNSDGTWDVGHMPTETEVKDGLGSLEECRSYVGSGRAQADLGHIQAETEDRLAPAGGELCFYCTNPAYVRDRGRMVCEGHDGCTELAGELREAAATVVSGSIGFGDGRDGITRIDGRRNR